MPLPDMADFSGDCGVGVLYIPLCEGCSVRKRRFLGNVGGWKKHVHPSSLCCPHVSLIAVHLFFSFSVVSASRLHMILFSQLSALSTSGYFSGKDKGVVSHHKTFQTAVFSLQLQGWKADFSWDLTGLLAAYPEAHF